MPNDAINNTVDIDEVRRLMKRLKEINSIPFMSIVWVDKGKKRVFPKQLLRDFRFTGLNNADFVMTKFWTRKLHG